MKVIRLILARAMLLMANGGKFAALLSVLLISLISIPSSALADLVERHDENGNVTYEGTPEELAWKENFDRNAVTMADGSRGVFTNEAGQNVTPTEFNEQLEAAQARVRNQAEQSIAHAEATGASAEDVRKAREETKKLEEAQRQQRMAAQAEATRKQMKVLISDENGRRDAG